jgi:fucose 4-O-acetylase-like acetyltransferase
MNVNLSSYAQVSAEASFSGRAVGQRQKWVDAARGMGIFLVVLGHVNRGLVSSGILPKTDLFIAADYTIYLFHMPLFFLLSGLTIRLHEHQSLNEFICRRLLLIVYAYFFWSVAQLSLQFYFEDYVNRSVALVDFARIFYAPIGQFWFLYALLICHLVFLITFGRISLIILAVVALASTRYTDHGVIPIAITAVYFVYYAFGLLAVKQLIAWRPPLAMLVFLIGSFAIAAALNWMLVGPNFIAPGAVPAAFLGIAAVIACSKLLVGPLASGLAVIGRLSLPIFLAHVIAASGVRVAMLGLGVPKEPILYVFCGVLAGILLPMLLYRVAARFDFLPLLGFAPFDGRSRNNLQSHGSKPA